MLKKVYKIEKIEEATLDGIVVFSHEDFFYVEDSEYAIEKNLKEVEIEFFTEEDKKHNDDILLQIKAKESELVRPMRELLSTTATAEAKEYAQSKVDEIELAIQELREELK